MPWSDFVCIIQKFHFFAELVSPSVGIVVHTDQDLLLRCTSSLDIWRTGDPWFNLPSIWEESLTNKSLQSNNELTHLLPTEPALTPADFKWALCRSRCLPVTRSGLAGDSLTIHLPLCTSQLSCPENRNTNSVSMLRSLFLRLPPPLHLGSEFHYLLIQQRGWRIWPAMVCTVRDLHKFQQSLGWIKVSHSPKLGGLRAPQLLIA